jgi:GNAT superfamily N-acetyltransferase
VASALSLRIMEATEKDTPLILEFIRQLAEYEKHLDKVEATDARLRRALFASTPKASVIFAYQGDRPVGFALFYYTYATFVAQPGLYLEDLFVTPAARGKGVGRELLGYLAKLALEKDCCRIEWAVLHWNEPAIRFYENLGAVANKDWATYRLSGQPLESLAREA